jgi:hypothetical protein
MHMDDAQQLVYLMYRAMKDVDKTKEAVVNCPYCKYFEIWDKDNSSNFFYCKEGKCKKSSCIVCHKSFHTPEGFSLNDDEFEEMKEEGGMLSHFKCYEYKDLKNEWETAIVDGNTRV